MGSPGPSDRSLDGVPQGLSKPPLPQLEGTWWPRTTVYDTSMARHVTTAQTPPLYDTFHRENLWKWRWVVFPSIFRQTELLLFQSRSMSYQIWIRFKPDYWRGLAGYLGPINKVWGLVHPGLALHYITSNTLHPSFKDSLAWPMPRMSSDVEVDSCIIAPPWLVTPKMFILNADVMKNFNVFWRTNTQHGHFGLKPIMFCVQDAGSNYFWHLEQGNPIWFAPLPVAMDRITLMPWLVRLRAAGYEVKLVTWSTHVIHSVIIFYQSLLMSKIPSRI